MSRRGWLLFISLGIIWGTPYLLIKVAVADLSPFVVVFGRVALAAAILLPIAAVTGQLRQLRGLWGWILVFAIVEISLPFWSLTWAEQRLSSSLTALVIAGVPLTAAVIARLLGLDHRLGPTRLLGLGIGILGVAALVGLDITGESALSVAALSIAVLGYALGPIIVDTKLSAAPSLAVIAVALTINAIGYAPLAWTHQPTDWSTVPAQAWWTVAVLGVLCTAIAFLLFFALIAEVGPARTTVITYVNPAVAVLLGIAIGGEQLTPGILVGFPLVILGSFLATRRSRTVDDFVLAPAVRDKRR